MPALPPVETILTASISAFEAKMGEAKLAMDDVGKSSDGMGSKLSSLGKGLTLGIAGAAIGIGAASVKMAMDWQTSMTQLVTGAGESKKAIGAVSTGMLNMAASVGTTPKDLAAGMYLIESAGYHGAEGLTVLKAAAEGAKVGNASLATVSDAVTTALTDYHLKASQAADVTSALVQTVADGKTHMQDLASAIGKVMPQAAGLGVSFQGITGAMATMTNAGLTARFAATHLSNMLLALKTPSNTAKTAMFQVGISADQLATTLSGSGGLSAGLSLIEKHVGSTFPAGSLQFNEAMKAIVGGVTGFATATMLGGKNAQEFANDTNNIGKALNANATQVQGFSQIQHDLGFQLDQVKDGAEALAIKLGMALIPKLEDVMHDTIAVVNWFAKHKDAAIALGVAITAGLAVPMGAFAVNTLGEVITNIKKAGSSVSDFIGKVTGAPGPITGAGGDINATVEGIATTMSETATSFQTSVEQMSTSMSAAAATIREQLASIGVQADETAAQIQADAAEIDAASAEAKAGSVLPGLGGVTAAATGGAEAAVGGTEAAVGAGETAVGAGEAAVGGTEVAAGAGFGSSVAVFASGVTKFVGGVAVLAAPIALLTALEKNTKPKTWQDTAKGWTMNGQPSAAPPAVAIAGRQVAAADMYAAALTPLQATMAAVRADGAKDKTVAGQMSVLNSLRATAAAQAAKYGANSPQELNALEAFRTTADKWLPGASTEKSLKSVDAGIEKAKETLSQLKDNQAYLSSEQSMKAAKVAVEAGNAKLKELRDNLATETSLKASAQAIQQTKSEITNTKAAINNTTGHLDLLRATAAQITKTQDTLNANELLRASIAKVNADTSGLKADIEKGIAITQLPQRNIKMTGNIHLVLR